MSLEESQDFDNFFYYGQGNLEKETESDILSLISQSARSLYYDRFYDSAGIDQFENSPISVIIQVLLPFAIVSAISKRNTITSGDGSSIDRRVAVSQNLISVEKGGDGEVNIQVGYVLFSDINTKQNVSIPLGVGV